MILHGDEISGYWLLIPINPEPWAVGPVQTGRRGGKIFANMGANQGLVAYQEAVREVLEGDGVKMLKGNILVEFWFHRVLDVYVAESGRTVKRNRADVTNMNKALEDAMQGILYENDRDNVDVIGHLMDSDHPNGFTVANVRTVNSLSVPPGFIFRKMQVALESLKNTGPSDLSWPPKEGMPF